MIQQIPHPLPSDWAKAVCRTEPDAWFSRNDGTQSEAKYACNHWCPLRDACLYEAVKAERANPGGRRHGVRGGLTAAERSKLIRATA